MMNTPPDISGKPFVLVVDDDKGFSRGLCDILESKGYDVASVYSGRDAEKYLAQADAVLVDYHLPDMDGISLIASLERQKNTLVSILITGYSSEKKVMEALKQGVDDYFTKPFDVDDLLRRLDVLLERNRLVRELEESNITLRENMRQIRAGLDGIIQAMAKAVETRDPYTAGHQRAVSTIARGIATELGMDSDRINCIRMAGVVHDVGKLAIPAEILSKPSRLSAIEFALIKTHSEKGLEILRGVPFPWPLAEIVGQHHERLDGSGYPEGLKDGAIHLEARIIAVADVVEAMSSHRPYRPSLGLEKALEEIKRGRGVQYDADAVDACRRVFEKQPDLLSGSFSR